MSRGASFIILMAIWLVNGQSHVHRIIRRRNVSTPNLRIPMCMWNGVRTICQSVPDSFINYDKLDNRIHDLAIRGYLRKRIHQEDIVRKRLSTQILNHVYLRKKLRTERRMHHLANKFTRLNDYIPSLNVVPTTSVYEDFQRTTKYYSETKFYFSKIPLPTASRAIDSSSFQYSKIVQDITTKITPVNVVWNNDQRPKPYTFKTELSKSFSPILSSTSYKPFETAEQQKNTNKNLFHSYLQSLDIFERELYTATFDKLIQISPVERKENGISFVQSGLLLNLFLMALSTETDNEVTMEMDKYFSQKITNSEKRIFIRDILAALPKSKNGLRWRWASRLILGHTQEVSQEFLEGAAERLHLTIERFNGTENPDEIAQILNRMVEKDSGGIIRDAFEPDEVSDGVRAVAVTTVNFRARWRTAPTVLNGTRAFRDLTGAPTRNIRMIRINDNVRYANFVEWSFEAIQIPYSTNGLTLLMLVPYGPSLRSLAGHIMRTGILDIINQMETMRIAVTMPTYTLRMTLLLPSKLQAMGIKKLVTWNGTDSGRLRLSHAVQRVMFWAEAGRNAFKDDGIEWDETPAKELTIDRPYLFFVRWKNMTLMNGNFVL